MPLPRRVVVEGRAVSIDWSDGLVTKHSARNLREACPCALCVGETAPVGTSRVIPLMAKVSEGISVVRYSPVGRYALAFAFSDGHSSGIYPFEYLRRICECDECISKKSAQP